MGDVLMKGKNLEEPKTSSTALKLTEALGEKKLVQADGNGEDSKAVKKDKHGKEMQKKEKNEKELTSAVKESTEKAASPTKSLKRKENELPAPAVSKPVEQGKAVALKSIRKKQMHRRCPSQKQG